MKKFDQNHEAYVMDLRSAVVFIPDDRHCFFFREESYHRPEDKELYHKIIDALKFESDDHFRIEVLPADHFIHIQWEGKTKSNVRFVFFGIRPSEIHLNGFDKKHHIYYLNDFSLMFADEASFYKENASRKLLWTVLQALFNK